MKKIAKADITWMPYEQGGRKMTLPVGIKYCPIIVFNSEQSSDALWCAELFNVSVNGRKSVADITYLVDNAPFYLLKSGNEFSLYEGQRIVAEGVIQ